MSESTPRLSLPLIMPGQAQKELYHNEALTSIDVALHPAVEGPPLATPPANSEPGRSWIIAAGATGDGAAGTNILPAGPTAGGVSWLPFLVCACGTRPQVTEPNGLELHGAGARCR